MKQSQTDSVLTAATGTQMIISDVKMNVNSAVKFFSFLFSCFYDAPQCFSFWICRKSRVNTPLKVEIVVIEFPITNVYTLQFDATLDVLSSVIVLWRYSNAAAVHSAHREYM